MIIILYVEKYIIDKLICELPNINFKILPTIEDYILMIDRFFHELNLDILEIMNNNYTLLINLIHEYNEFIITFKRTLFGDEYKLSYRNVSEKIENCITFIITSKFNITLDRVDKCNFSGSINILKFENFARNNGFKYINLEYESYIHKCGISYSLKLLYILTKGQSWYNSLGYNYIDKNKDYSSILLLNLIDFLNYIKKNI